MSDLDLEKEKTRDWNVGYDVVRVGCRHFDHDNFDGIFVDADSDDDNDGRES